MSEFQKITQFSVANAFGVSTKVIRKWTRDGMPRNLDDSYDLSRCIEWRVGQYMKTSTMLAKSLMRRAAREEIRL